MNNCAFFAAATVFVVGFFAFATTTKYYDFQMKHMQIRSQY